MLIRAALWTLRSVGHRYRLRPGPGPYRSPGLAWPMAVGAVLVPRPVGGRSLAEDRLMLALDAYKLGYFLLDLIDIPAWAAAEETRGWEPVWALAQRAQADAVIVYSGDTTPSIPKAPTPLRHVPVQVLTPDGR